MIRRPPRRMPPPCRRRSIAVAVPAPRAGRFAEALAAALGAAVVAAMASAAAGQVTVVNEHPRLVFRATDPDGQTRTFQDVRELSANNADFRREVGTWISSASSDPGPIANASRYVLTGDRSYAEKALDDMSAGSLSFTTSQGGLRGEQWALAYDWIYGAWDGASAKPADLQAKLANIEGKLAAYTRSALAELDRPSLSLWHGRSAVGASTFVAALALPTGDAAYDDLRLRAFHHWQQSLLAAHASGGWPEGPSYWATSRAIHYPLAYEAYRSAVRQAPALAVQDPLEDLRTMGLWQAYMERGDGTMERYGDVAAQVAIANGTLGISIDAYAQATRDPALAAFAQHARRYRDPLAHSEYRWATPITYDPTQPRPAGYDPKDPGASVGAALPDAIVFGRDSLGLVAMRQGWEPGDTAITFKAGDYLVHHNHCDQGTFTIFKNAPLVIHSGGYSTIDADHRLNYHARTVSTNSLLIQRPDERWTPPGTAPAGGYANDGGQRIVNATGGAVTSYANWLANKTAGQHYETGDITAFASVDGRYTYVGSDLTAAYNSTAYDSEGQGGKVSQVTRQVVYLPGADAMIVFDRVRATDPAYRKKWLLHTPNRMLGGAEIVVRGSAADGIVTVDGATIPGRTLTMTNGEGRLFLQTLLPASYTVHKVGGPNHAYYVEDDGNDADGYDGTNHAGGYTAQPHHDAGAWRIELSPKAPATFDTFLHVLTPRDAGVQAVTSAKLLAADEAATVLRVGQQVVGFGTLGRIDAPFGYDVDAGGAMAHLVVDLVPGQEYRIAVGDGWQHARADAEGVLSFATATDGAFHVGFEAVLGGTPGDADLDGAVSPADLAIVASHWNAEGCWDCGDFTGDGRIDLADLAGLAAHWNEGAPAGAAVDLRTALAQTPQIPEPATLAVLAVGGAALLRR